MKKIRFYFMLCIIFASIISYVSCSGSLKIKKEIKLYVPTKLESNEQCNRCKGYYLPGSHKPSPHTFYRIDSDLPEIFYTNGVLYTTREILPPFKTKKGEDVPETMRHQKNAGFKCIDDSFEVFLYHLSQKHEPSETRRIIIYVKNIGDIKAFVNPRQSLFHGPNAANPNSVESLLGEAVLSEKWDSLLPLTSIKPGEGAVIGFSKQLGAEEEGKDITRAEFVTGILRAQVTGEGDKKPKLEVSVISIPGNVEYKDFNLEAEKWINIGAQSGEGAMDLLIPPPECHVRRVVGVAKNVIWQNDLAAIDISKLSEERIPFQMAMFGVQSAGCMEARQSVDLLLHPGYVHSDSVGNYMMEYSINLFLINGGNTPKNIDIEFGKDDAPIGLAWQISITGKTPELNTNINTLPVHIDWAGKGRSENYPPYYTKSMLDSGPLKFEKGDGYLINIRLMVLGTSSLPYQLHLVSK